MWTLSLVPTSNLIVALNRVFVFRTCDLNFQLNFSIKFSTVSSGRLQNLWRLLLYHEGGLDEGVEEDVEPVGQLGQDVHARLLARDVQPLVDHLKLPDLLSIQPNNLGKVFAPE